MKKFRGIMLLVVLMAACSAGDGGVRGRKAAEAVLTAALADEAEFGFFPDTDEGRLASAAEWFETHGPASRRADAWFCLGRMQEQDGALHKAVVSYERALAGMRKTGDAAIQGRIRRHLAHVYNASREYVPAAQELYAAWQDFRQAGESEGDAAEKAALKSEELATLLEYGQAWYNLEDLAQAEKVYKAALSEAHAAADTLAEVGALRSFASLVLQKDVPEAAAAIEMLSRVADDLRFPLGSEDNGVLAYAYSLLGKNREAHSRLKLALALAETREEQSAARFRAYQVASQEGRAEDALRALEKVVEFGDAADLSAMKEAVSLSREDYLAAQGALASARLKASRWGSAALIMLLLAVGSTALWYLRARREEIERLRSEAAETVGIAEELRARLAESSRVLKGAVAGKNEILERLCEQYYIYGESDKLPSRLLKEARAAIEGLRDDPKVLEGFEKAVNAAHDGAVDKLRSQLPRCKDEDVKLFVLAASGLSRTAMATILEKEKGVVNNRLWRLKGRIADSDAADKALLLGCIEG